MLPRAKTTTLNGYTQVSASKHTFFVNNPLFTACSDLISKKEKPEIFAALTSSIKNEFIILKLQTPPVHRLFQEQGFDFNEAHFRIDKKIAASQSEKKSHLSAAHYTATYQHTDGTILTAHVYFHKDGTFRSLEVYTQKADEPKHTLMMNTECEKQLQENAGALPTLLEHCNHHIMHQLHWIMRQIEQREAKLSELSQDLQDKTKQNTYLAEAKVFLMFTKKADGYSEKPLKLEQSVEQMIENIEKKQISFETIENDADEEDSDEAEENTASASSRSTKRNKRKLTTKKSIQSEIGEAYQAFLKLEGRSDADSMRRKIRLSEKIQDLFAIANIHGVEVTHLQPIKQTLFTTRMRLYNNALTLFKNGEVETVKQLIKKSRFIQSFQFVFFLDLLSAAITCNDNEKIKKMKTFFDQCRINEPHYTMAIKWLPYQYFNSLIQDKEKQTGIMFSTIFMTAQVNNIVIFKMLLEHGCAWENHPGMYYDKTPASLLRCLLTLEDKQFAKILLDLGAWSHTDTQTHRLPGFVINKNSNPKTLLDLNFPEDLIAHQEYLDIIDVHSALQLACLRLSADSHTVLYEMLKHPSIDLVSIALALSTLVGPAPSPYNACLINVSNDKGVHFFKSLEDSNRVALQPVPVTGTFKIAYHLHPKKEGNQANTHLLERVCEKFNQMILDLDETTSEEIILEAVNRIQQRSYHPHTMTDRFKIQTSACLFLLASLKKVTTQHFNQMLTLHKAYADKLIQASEIDKANTVYRTIMVLHTSYPELSEENEVILSAKASLKADEEADAALFAHIGQLDGSMNALVFTDLSSASLKTPPLRLDVKGAPSMTLKRE